MTSTEATLTSKRANDSSKKAYPLKVVSPIIKKYSGQRQGRIKKKLEFPRRLSGRKNKNASQTKPSLKSILPKTNAGDVIILESELLPCALNLPTKPNKEELDAVDKSRQLSDGAYDDKKLKISGAKDSGIRGNKTKVNLSSKRKKCLKNLEAAFALLKPQAEVLKDKREQAFAENYLLRVQQKLKGKDDALYIQFVDLICDFQRRGMRVIDLYKRVRQLFSEYSDLGEDFIAFLSPQQAVECGVFIEHLLLTTMTDFLNMIDVYFLKSPQQIRKIHSAIEKLSTRQNLTTEDVTNAVLPLLKGNTVLQDYFLKLLPHGTPPNNFFMDYEEVEYPELSSDISEDEEHFEIVKVPEVEDVFGGDSCPCNCHNSTDEKFQARVLHCNSCSVKFINGKIFIQQGKLLRPAKVTFEDFDISYHRDRLVPKHYPNGGRKKTRATMLKENLSPMKSSYHSSDEFKSDIEDDERIKSKLGLTKSPRAGNRKTISPKNCDKNVVRSIFYDQNASINFLDGMDAEGKFPDNRCLVDFNWGEDKPIADMDLDPPKNDVGLIGIESGAEFAPPENKPLDLPLIDGEEAMFFNEDVVPGLEKEDDTIRIDTPVFMEKEDDTIRIDTPVFMGKDERMGIDTPVFMGKDDTIRIDTPVFMGKDERMGIDTPVFMGKDDTIRIDTPVFMGKDDTIRIDTPVFMGKDERMGIDTPVFMGKDETIRIDTPVFMEKDERMRIDTPVFMEKDERIRINSPVFMEKDGSKSPPVLSIPDTANTSMFPSGKPILSFLENLDNAKEPGLLMSDSDAVINFDTFSDTSRNESDVVMMPAPEEFGPEKESDESPWKIEEDRIILQTLQVEENCEETFRKINEKIPTRSLDDIKNRFANLMNILYEMKARTSGAVGSN